MRFEKIRINNFRNISSQIVDISAEDIVLIGENAQGKTNFLEALYILCYGSSFKTPNLREAVRHGENGFFLEATFINDYDERQYVMFSYENGKRNIEIDGKKIIDRKELIYQFPCIIFSHEDIEFLKGEPETRRKFFDQMMSLSNPSFLDDIRLYRNVLSKRNAAIKTSDKSLITLYDERLAKYGLVIMNEREKAVKEFNSIFPHLFSVVSGGKDDLYIHYQKSWQDVDSVDDIVCILKENIDRDIKMQTTTSGIHRDRFSVRDGNGIFNQTGSTGQLRLCSLIFRIVESKFFEKNTDKKPIFLFDDVLLELDNKKRSVFLDQIDSYSQAFFTFLPREIYFDEKHKKPLCYNVIDGKYSL